MQDRQEIRVSQLLDDYGVSSFHIKLIVWTVLIVLVDGYDIGCIAFAAPELLKAWHANPGQLGPVLGSALIGILFGSALFGWIGDRYGRKAAMIGSLLTFGVFTLLGVWATSLYQMFWLRLLAGIGIGGIVPNVVAINAESAPRRLRGTLALIAVGFVPLGAAFAGLVSWLFVAKFGWQILFWVGGLAPIALALVAIIGMPESIKFMALREAQWPRLQALLKSVYPQATIPGNVRFVIEDEKQYPGFNPAHLFKDGLAIITPLVWLVFALNLMAYFFLLSWTPTLLTNAHLPRESAALATTLLQIGGTVGALLMCNWINRQGFLAISLLFLLSVPVVGSIGFTGISSEPALMISAFFAGFFVLGIQSGLNVIGALIYSTSLRANGSGWELGLGRLGSLLGPLLGGLFVALPVQQLYMWSAVPLLVAALLCFIVDRLNRQRMAGQVAFTQPVAAE